MVAVKDLKQRAQRADDSITASPSYHETLGDLRSQWERANRAGQQLLRTGEVSGSNDEEADTSTVEGSARALSTIPDLDRARFVNPDGIEALTASGRAGVRGVNRRSPLLQGGRMKFTGGESAEGLPLNDGSLLTLGREQRDLLARSGFETEASFAFRAGLTLPSDFLKEVRLPVDTIGAAWEDVPEGKRGRHYQGAYEMMLALSILERVAPDTHASLLESSKFLHSLSSGSVKPYLSGLSPEFQKQFAIKQLDLAWAWRNKLEPGKGQRKPELTAKDVLFRNQMGLGMLEYLLPTGKAALEYLRAYGKELTAAPYRRTEIKQEHMQQFLTGVPLEEGQILAGTPELLIHLAREHHSLWCFSRETSWLLPDAKYHQPPRHVHVPWAELNVDAKNRDILNIFGVAYMLGQFSEKDFNTLCAAAAPGNPLGYSFNTIKPVSDSKTE